MLDIKNNLYRDPIYDGAADPTVIYNRQDGSLWMFYTNRRATLECDGVEWVHGTDIGIAVSTDGENWEYKGIAQGLEYEAGRNTYWAPEIIFADNAYHMYVSYVPGTPKDWNANRYILHYTSKDLLNWHFEARLELSSDKCIDACVHRLPDGKWGLWYKDEANGSFTYMVTSEDLYKWSNPTPVITDRHHEGPNVFFWKGQYFMLVDTWKGQGVYTSKDCVHWEQQEPILVDGGEGEDFGNGLHADVLVQGERAYIFYFTHPGRREGEKETFLLRRSTIQIRELQFEGGRLSCDRK